MNNATARSPRGVHLVGSVPLDTAEQVFRTVGSALGQHVRRIPDGETGDRSQWVQFQLGVLGARPEFQLVDSSAPGYENLPPTLVLRPGVAAEDVDFSGLGYAKVALESFETFARLQADGVIPEGVRFQISVPTPLANATAWMQADPQFPVLFERYTEAMLGEVAAALSAIPHERVAVQWDVCFEVMMLEGWMPMPQGVDAPAIAAHLARISNVIPSDVELGYHFCFGDFGHVHLQEPVDTGHIAELIDAFAGQVDRPIQWMHLPVPIERDDDAYFKPLRDLAIPEGTELYLGLVHFRDGVEGTRRRIATAQRAVSSFGVATECGMGRRSPERGGGDALGELLAIHAQVADPVSAR